MQKLVFDTQQIPVFGEMSKWLKDLIQIATCPFGNPGAQLLKP